MVNPMEHAFTTNPLKQILQLLATLPAEKLATVQDYLRFLQTNPPPSQQVNGNGVAHGQEQSDYAILLTKQADNGYLARPLALPELTVAGKDEAEALARVSAAIVNLQTQSRIVHISIPAANGTHAIEDDPWLRFAGQWGDEREWTQFQADMAANRQQIDQQTQADWEA